MNEEKVLSGTERLRLYQACVPLNSLFRTLQETLGRNAGWR